MNAWDELVERCAQRRLRKIGPLSEQAYAELVLAVRENPASFVDAAPEQALLVLAQALDAYRASLRDDDLLDDDAYQAARVRRLTALRDECVRARAIDEGCLDAHLLELLATDLDPDPLLAALLETQRGFGLDDGDASAASADTPGGDAWNDVFQRPHLRLRAAVARTCLDGARFKMAAKVATSVIDATPSDPLGARHTCMLAYARLEDEAGLDAIDARLGRRESSWSHLARTLLLYKLDRLPAARRALRGYCQLCEGGAYALLRPTYVEVYLPDRPEATPCSFEECLLAVREAEPIIADVPDFISWCQGFDWLTEDARSFAEKNDLDW